MSLRSIEILVGEHRQVEKVLEELEALIDEFLTSPEISPSSRQSLERLAESLGNDLPTHIRKEDEGLFPALQKFLPGHAGPLAVMLEEHEQITDSFRGLKEGLTHLQCCPGTDTWGAGQVRDHGRALIQALRSHLFKEEQVLFPFAEAHLTDADDRQILQAYEQVAASAAASARASQ